MDWSARDTIVGLATPPGKGGVAIVRISGDRALEVASSMFRLASDQAKPQEQTIRSHHLHYGDFVDPKDGRYLDRGLLAFMRSPNSFTGEDVVELQIHGGHMAPKSVIHAILGYAKENPKEANLRLAEPGEFSFRAFINQRIDLTQAEAVHELVDSQNSLAQRLALERLRGSWQSSLEELLRDLKELLSHFEVDLDFPEEGLATEEVSLRLDKLETIEALLADWIQASHWQQLAEEPIKIVLAGPPNVGKSTLFNLLLAKERAIVDATPGTTRDYLEASLDIGGLPLSLIDTAGIHAASEDPTEIAGMQRTRQSVGKADMVIWVDDPRTIGADEREQIAETMHEESSLQHIFNKMDLLDREAMATIEKSYPEAILLSAMHRQGIDKLQEMIESWCRERLQSIQQSHFVANERQQKAIKAAHQHILQAKQVLGRGADELVAEELWSASKNLEELSGRSLSPEVIESIFQNFCIGK